MLDKVFRFQSRRFYAFVVVVVLTDSSSSIVDENSCDIFFAFIFCDWTEDGFSEFLQRQWMQSPASRRRSEDVQCPLNTMEQRNRFRRDKGLLKTSIRRILL